MFYLNYLQAWEGVKDNDKVLADRQCASMSWERECVCVRESVCTHVREIMKWKLGVILGAKLIRATECVCALMWMREREWERVFWVQRPLKGRRGSGKEVFFRKRKSQIIDVLHDSGAPKYTAKENAYFSGRYFIFVSATKSIWTLSSARNLHLNYKWYLQRNPWS